ncbi:MAG: hypothetical protein EOO43_09345, partial [Flavobacterium sp.]
MRTSFENWLDYMNSQIDFYNKNAIQSRSEIEKVWKSYKLNWKSKAIKRIKDSVKGLMNYSLEKKWFVESSRSIFVTRELLADEYSKLQFDLYILLKVVGHNKFYFPRNHFEDLLI